MQYTKDFSFENPNAPRSLGPQETGPNISIQVNVNARPLSEEDFEVNLLLEGSASTGEAVLFKFELDYAGVFKIRGIPAEHMHPLLMVECPRYLFPFARRIIADLSIEGGFPPFMLEPLDFAGIYAQRRAQGAPAQFGNA